MAGIFRGRLNGLVFDPKLTGVHDMAVADMDGDGRPDCGVHVGPRQFSAGIGLPRILASCGRWWKLGLPCMPVWRWAI